MPRHLSDANRKLQISESSARACGPSIGGFVVQVLSAPVAFAADSASFVVSVVSLVAIRTPEPPPDRPEVTDLPAEISEGLRLVFGHRALRRMVLAAASLNLFASIKVAVYAVFLVRQIGLSAGVIGLLASSAAIGGLIGAFSASFFARRLGPARVIWLAPLVCGPFARLIPLTSPGLGPALYALGTFIPSLGSAVYNVNEITYRQLLSPPGMLGRMNATIRAVAWGTLPIGALTGGALVTRLGNRDALWIAAAGVTRAPLWLLTSPLRTARDTSMLLQTPTPAATGTP